MLETTAELERVYNFWSQVEFYGQVPEEKTRISPRQKREMIKRFDDAGVFDYEPNKLDSAELEILQRKIRERIVVLDDEVKIESLKMLLGYIDRNNAIAPELTHGTSSLVLESILENGLQPGPAARGLQNKKQVLIGEGKQIEKKGKGISDSIHLGIGQGGLGVALAYAEMNLYATWNPYSMPLDDLDEKLRSLWELESKLRRINYPDRLELKDMILVEKVLEKLKIDIFRLQDAYSRYRPRKEHNFPLLIGSDWIKQAGYLSPKNNKYQFLTEREFKKGSLIRFEGMDSELTVGECVVTPGEIKLFGCPFVNLSRLKNELSENGMSHVEVIPFEAFAELDNLGLTRFKEAKDRAMQIIINGLNLREIELSIAESIARSTVPAY